MKLTYSNRKLAGQYQETLIDEKKKSNNRLVSVCGKYYTVITESGSQIDIVGKSNFNKWASKNEYVTDF